jgi:hypothetical protein
MLALYHHLQAIKRKKMLNKLRATHSPLLIEFNLSFTDPISYRSVTPVEKKRIIFVPNNILIKHNYEQDAEWHNRLIMNIVDRSAHRYYSQNDLCDCSQIKINLNKLESIDLTCVNHAYFMPKENFIAEDRIKMVQLCNAKIGVNGSKLLTLKNFTISSITNLKLDEKFKYFIYEHKDFAIAPRPTIPQTVINYWGYGAN